MKNCLHILSRFKNAPLNNIDFSVKKKSVYLSLKLQTRKAFIWLRSDHKQTCYLTQKCDTHQLRIRIARGHFQGLIFAKSSFRKGSFPVIWNTRTRLLILALLNSWSLLVTWCQNFENGILRHYFSKASVIVDVFEQNIYQTISLITS